MKRLFALSVLIILFSLTYGGIPPLNAEESADEEFTLEEITVTAEKREENQQKVPIAMEVITKDQIKMAGKTDLDTILSYVSSAVIQRATDGLRVALRGLSDDTGAFRSQMQATPTVAINTDGVMTNRKDTGAGLFDVERVEVLYGPQSTLYSSNSPGGIVNIITTQPNTERVEASGTLEYGSYNLLHTEGALNVPIGDKVAVRTAFTTQKRDGYLDNGEDDADSKAVRLKALLNPADNLSITLTGMYSKSDSMGRSGGVVEFVDQDDVDDPWTFNQGSTATGQGYQHSDKQNYSADIEWSTKIGTVTAVPSYSKGTSEYTNTDTSTSTIIDGERWSEEKGMEARLSSNPDFFFKWIIGATYYESSDTNFRDVRDSEQGGTRTVSEDAKAFFANVTYPVTDQFRMSVGYRQSWDDFTTDNYEVRPMKGGGGTAFEISDTTVLMEYAKPDIKVGFEYDLSESAMLYGDYSTSYRVQGMNAGAGTPDPERLKAYTLGAKTRFFGNKFQANIAAYYYDYTNYRANQNVMVRWDTNGDGVLNNQDDNYPDPNGSQTGDGNFMGIDLQTTAIITTQDMLNVSVSWEKSEWTDLYFDYYYEWTQVVDEETGEIVTVPIEDVSYNGKSMANTPPLTISASYSHNFILWNGGSIKPTLNVRYQTDYRVSWPDADYPVNYQESYYLADFTAVYTHPNNKLNFSIYVRNIENYAVKRGYYGTMKKLIIGEPRTYGAVLSLKF